MNYQDPHTVNIPINMPPPKQKVNNIGIKVLLVILGLIILSMAMALILSMSHKASVNAKLQEELYQNGRTAGHDEARKEYKNKLEADFQTYTSAEEYGKFTVTFPKYWSYYVEESDSGDPLKGLASPNGIHQGREKYALRFDLFDKKFSDYNASLKEKAKSKPDCTTSTKLCVESIKISGIDAQKYIGDINDNGSKGIAIIAPLRDKTFYIATDIPELYESSFNIILDKVKLNP